MDAAGLPRQPALRRCVGTEANHAGFPLGCQLVRHVLAVTNLKDDNEANDKNVTKVNIEWIKKELIGRAIDFNKDI